MSELDKTIEELEKIEVQNELSEAEMKKDTSASGNAVAAEPMKKMDSEDEDAEDTGAAVTKSSDPKKDYAKKVKTDGSIPAKVKGDEKPQNLPLVPTWKGIQMKRLEIYVILKTMTVQQLWNTQYGV